MFLKTFSTFIKKKNLKKKKKKKSSANIYSRKHTVYIVLYPVAQWLECPPCNLEGHGSNPPGGGGFEAYNGRCSNPPGRAGFESQTHGSKVELYIVMYKCVY